MDFLVLEKLISLDTMEKPKGILESIFEFTGTDSLAAIGLKEKFWFRPNAGFSNVLPVSENQIEMTPPKNGYQKVLSTFLERCIRNGRLTGQFEDSI